MFEFGRIEHFSSSFQVASVSDNFCFNIVALIGTVVSEKYNVTNDPLQWAENQDEILNSVAKGCTWVCSNCQCW